MMMISSCSVWSHLQNILCVYVSPRNWWAEQVFPIILTKICKWIFSLKVEISMAFLLLKFSLFLIHSSGNSFLVDMNSQPGKRIQSTYNKFIITFEKLVPFLTDPLKQMEHQWTCHCQGTMSSSEILLQTEFALYVGVH